MRVIKPTSPGRLCLANWHCADWAYSPYFLHQAVCGHLPAAPNSASYLPRRAVGIVSGVVVTAMSFIAQQMHEMIFRLDEGERLSSIMTNDHILLLIAPVTGGAILGLLLLILNRYRKRPMVDPIEANALHGGRLSLNDSLIIAAQNLISNGFGASVGLEAGYTQLASGLASKIGLSLQLRRSDLRILVGCGAAGAIAAAFNAPADRFILRLRADHRLLYDP